VKVFSLNDLSRSLRLLDSSIAIFRRVVLFINCLCFHFDFQLFVIDIRQKRQKRNYTHVMCSHSLCAHVQH
jgi:hypothetical protein